MERKVDGAMGTAADELIELHPEAATLAFQLMAASAASNGALIQDLLEGEQRAHAETRTRLRAAEYQLNLIRHRHAFMCGDVDTLNPWDEDLR
jgi:hypothetical protein